MKKAGVDYSHATGEFYAKPVAVKGLKERLVFLVKGLRWAVKRFEEALPRLDSAAKELFARMSESHKRSITSCESLLR